MPHRFVVLLAHGHYSHLQRSLERCPRCNATAPCKTTPGESACAGVLSNAAIHRFISKYRLMHQQQPILNNILHTACLIGEAPTLTRTTTLLQLSLDLSLAGIRRGPARCSSLAVSDIRQGSGPQQGQEGRVVGPAAAHHQCIVPPVSLFCSQSATAGD